MIRNFLKRVADVAVTVPPVLPDDPEEPKTDSSVIIILDDFSSTGKDWDGENGIIGDDCSDIVISIDRHGDPNSTTNDDGKAAQANSCADAAEISSIHVLGEITEIPDEARGVYNQMESSMEHIKNYFLSFRSLISSDGHLTLDYEVELARVDKELFKPLLNMIKIHKSDKDFLELLRQRLHDQIKIVMPKILFCLNELLALGLRFDVLSKNFGSGPDILEVDQKLFLEHYNCVMNFIYKTVDKNYKFLQGQERNRLDLITKRNKQILFGECKNNSIKEDRNSKDDLTRIRKLYQGLKYPRMVNREIAKDTTKISSTEIAMSVENKDRDVPIPVSAELVAITALRTPHSIATSLADTETDTDDDDENIVANSVIASESECFDPESQRTRPERRYSWTTDDDKLLVRIILANPETTKKHIIGLLMRALKKKIREEKKMSPTCEIDPSICVCSSETAKKYFDKIAYSDMLPGDGKFGWRIKASYSALCPSPPPPTPVSPPLAQALANPHPNPPPMIPCLLVPPPPPQPPFAVPAAPAIYSHHLPEQLPGSAGSSTQPFQRTGRLVPPAQAAFQSNMITMTSANGYVNSPFKENSNKRSRWDIEKVTVSHARNKSIKDNRDEGFRDGSRDRGRDRRYRDDSRDRGRGFRDDSRDRGRGFRDDSRDRGRGYKDDTRNRDCNKTFTRETEHPRDREYDQMRQQSSNGDSIYDDRRRCGYDRSRTVSYSVNRNNQGSSEETRLSSSHDTSAHAPLQERHTKSAHSVSAASSALLCDEAAFISDIARDFGERSGDPGDTSIANTAKSCSNNAASRHKNTDNDGGRGGNNSAPKPKFTPRVLRSNPSELSGSLQRVDIAPVSRSAGFGSKPLSSKINYDAFRDAMGQGNTNGNIQGGRYITPPLAAFLSRRNV